MSGPALLDAAGLAALAASARPVASLPTGSEAMRWRVANGLPRWLVAEASAISVHDLERFEHTRRPTAGAKVDRPGYRRVLGLLADALTTDTLAAIADAVAATHDPARCGRCLTNLEPADV